MCLYLLWLIITNFVWEKPPNISALGFRETFTYIPRPDSLMFVRIVIPGDENTRDAELGCFSQNPEDPCMEYLPTLTPKVI